MTDPTPIVPSLKPAPAAPVPPPNAEAKQTQEEEFLSLLDAMQQEEGSENAPLVQYMLNVQSFAQAMTRMRQGKVVAPVDLFKLLYNYLPLLFRDTAQTFAMQAQQLEVTAGTAEAAFALAQRTTLSELLEEVYEELVELAAMPDMPPAAVEKLNALVQYIADYLPQDVGAEGDEMVEGEGTILEPEEGEPEVVTSAPPVPLPRLVSRPAPEPIIEWGAKDQMKVPIIVEPAQDEPEEGA